MKWAVQVIASCFIFVLCFSASAQETTIYEMHNFTVNEDHILQGAVYFRTLPRDETATSQKEIKPQLFFTFRQEEGTFKKYHLPENSLYVYIGKDEDAETYYLYAYEGNEFGPLAYKYAGIPKFVEKDTTSLTTTSRQQRVRKMSFRNAGVHR